jgi:glutamate-1-semialdehyde 2,1-aminomutase
LSRSDELFEEARKVIPGGVNSPVRAFGAVGGVPPFIVRGEGAWIEDADGRRYIDYVQSWGALLFGHARREIVDAAIEAARRGTSFGAPTEAEVRLAQRIVATFPSTEEVRLVSSGTEACMSAIRLARGATGRSKILKFDGCYHGHADALLAKAGSGVATFGLPGTRGVTEGAAADTVVVPYNDLTAVKEAFGALGEQIAAVIVEPVAANMGVIPPEQDDEDFLEGLRLVTEEFGALLIFDEVITGFRVWPGGAQSLYDVTPDLTTLGKVMGGGFPCAAFGGRRDLMEQLAPVGPVYQAGTLSGNPVAVAAGLATFDLIDREDPFLDLSERGSRLFIELRELLEAAGAPVPPPPTNGVNGLFSVFFSDEPVRDYASARRADHERYARFFHGMQEEGIYLPPSGYEAWFLSTAHGDDEIDRTLEAARKVAPAIG